MTYLPAVFRCNGCGVERQKTNNWYELHSDEGSRDCGMTRKASLVIRAFSQNEAAKHYCGESCLLKAISELAPTLQNHTEYAE